MFFYLLFLPQNRSTTEKLSKYFDQKIIPRLNNKHLIHIAYDHDKMIGFSIFEKWKKKSYYLSEMAVLPEYQGRGIGKQLAFSIFSKTPEAIKLVLVTEKQNKWSQSFYEKIGFTLSSFQHPDYPENFIGYEFLKTPGF